MKKLLPPIVVGVVMVIGLALAHTAVNMAMNGADGKYALHFSVALVTLLQLYARYLEDFQYHTSVTWRRIYLRLLQGLVDLKPVAEAKWFVVPDFTVH